MPRIIRQALGERIRRDPELQRLLADLSRATGVHVAYAGPLGHRSDEPQKENEPLCARLRRDGEGCRLCARFQQALFEAAAQQAVTRRCEAGLTESAVPLRAAGQTIGYLVVGGHVAASPDRTQLNRARHLLNRAGVQISDAEFEESLSKTRIVAPERQAALVSLLQLAAEHLTARITERLVQPDTKMPPLVERACRLVHAEFAQPVIVPEIARRLGASEGHLSRTFHRATGLRFVEYVARFRAGRARALLRETDRPVTEIAFACGFQSLSQFNRVFSAQFGIPPRTARAEAQGTGRWETRAAA